MLIYDTLPVVTRPMHDHYMGTSSKDEMYSLIYKSNLKLQTQLYQIIGSCPACTCYEINIHLLMFTCSQRNFVCTLILHC